MEWVCPVFDLPTCIIPGVASEISIFSHRLSKLHQKNEFHKVMVHFSKEQRKR